MTRGKGRVSSYRYRDIKATAFRFTKEGAYIAIEGIDLFMAENTADTIKKWGEKLYQ